MTTQIQTLNKKKPRNFKNEIVEMHAHIEDLFQVRGWIFWGDMCFSAITGWTCLALSIAASSIPIKIVLIGIAAIFVYRAMVFTHEIVHLRKGELPGFRIAWHLLCGIPMLAPNFLYRRVHLTHHNKNHYSTKRDGEYVPFKKSHALKALLFVCSGISIPLVSVFRFCILSPAYWIHPKARQLVEVYGSAMGIKVVIQREPPANSKERLEWTGYELACFALIVTIGSLTYRGVLPISTIACWYALVCLVVTMNAIRAICCTHLYIHEKGIPVELREQIEDSVNLGSSSLLAVILCPVGTRYHCLHHIFPTIPYHAAKEAHQRLMKSVPTDSFYKDREIKSLFEGWKQVWPSRNGKEVDAQEIAVACFKGRQPLSE